MNFQKERELFLAHMRSIGSAGFMFELDEDGNFDDMSMAYAWSAWQAAKAQAVPEGFLLMPRKCTNKMAHAAKAVDGRLSAFKYADVYDAMVEAQEPAND